MIDTKRVVFSYLDSKIAKSMTKEEAQKIVDEMSKEKLEKIKRIFKKWMKWFKKPGTKEAALFDVLKKINKVTGVPVLELTAVGMLFFGGLFPSYAGTPSEGVDTEQAPAEASIRKQIEQKIDLPDKLEALVEKRSQGVINFMGMFGFLGAVKKYMKQSLTPEISGLLLQLPEDQWPEILSEAMMQKIKVDPEVSVKFKAFADHHKKTDKNMVDAIQKEVEGQMAKVKKHVENNAMKKVAFERGYLIS